MSVLLWLLKDSLLIAEFVLLIWRNEELLKGGRTVTNGIAVLYLDVFLFRLIMIDYGWACSLGSGLQLQFELVHHLLVGVEHYLSAIQWVFNRLLVLFWVAAANYILNVEVIVDLALLAVINEGRFERLSFYGDTAFDIERSAVVRILLLISRLLFDLCLKRDWVWFEQSNFNQLCILRSNDLHQLSGNVDWGYPLD